MRITVKTSNMAIHLLVGGREEPLAAWQLYRDKVRAFMHDEFRRPFAPTVTLNEEQSARLIALLPGSGSK